MAVELATAYVSIVPSGKGFGKALRSEVDGADLEGVGASQGSKSGGAFAKMFVGALAAGGLAKGFASVISEASGLEESISKNTVVFGDASKGVLDFAENADTALGQSKSQALEATGVFGNLLRAVGLTDAESANMSVSMTTLASDLASFNNTSVDDALLALRAGLVGETEPLKKFGVNMNEATLKAKALEMGLVKGEASTAKIMAAQLAAGQAQRKYTEAVAKYGAGSVEATEAAKKQEIAEAKLAASMEGKVPALDSMQKSQAAYGLIMDQTALAQGDFARTSDGLANKQRILGAQFDNVKAQIGTALLPAVTSLVGMLSDNLEPTVKRIGDFLKENWQPVLGAVAAVVVGLVVPSMLSWAVATLAATWPILLAVAALAALGYGLVWAYKNVEPFREAVDKAAVVLREKLGQAIEWVQENWPKVQAAFQSFSEYVSTKLIPTVQEIATKISTTLRPILEQIAQRLIPLVIDSARKLREGFANVVAWVEANWSKIQEVIGVSMGLVQGHIERVLGIVEFIWNAVGENVLDIVETAFGFIQSAIGAAMKVVQGIIETVMAVITGDWGGAWDGIKKIFAGVWDGIRNILTSAISVIRSILGGIGALLWDLVGGPLMAMAAWAGAAVQAVVDFITGIPGRIMGVGTAIATAIADGLKSAWNEVAKTVNDLIPDSIPLPFGNSLDIAPNPLPILHNGGIVPGRPGEEVLALLEAGERVTSRADVAAGGAGGLVVNHNYSGIPADRAIEMAVARQRRDLAGMFGAAMVGAA